MIAGRSRLHGTELQQSVWVQSLLDPRPHTIVLGTDPYCLNVTGTEGSVLQLAIAFFRPRLRTDVALGARATMHESTTPDNGTGRGRSTGAGSSRPTTERLAAVVVSEENQPDRRTVYPANRSNAVTRTAWLTANASDFVDLEEWR